MPTRIRFRRGTTTAWATANPILDPAEPGVETDTGKWKLGDGSTHWNMLAYQAGNVAGITQQQLTDALATKANLTHASTHGATGSDPLTLTPAQVTGLSSALAGKADLVGGLLPTNQLPPLSITNVYVVANQAAMLALAVQVGDVAIRTDTSRTYILATSPATTLANWTEITSPGAVTSVAGKTGTVLLAGEDITTGTVPYPRLPVGQAPSTVAAGNDPRFADYATRLTALEAGTTPPTPGVTVPGAPTAVTATPGVRGAGVTFTAPASTGGAAVTLYRVTATTGQTATGTSSPINATGLTAGVAVRFSVAAQNSAGWGPESALSAPVTPIEPPPVGSAPSYVRSLGDAPLATSAGSVELTTTDAVVAGDSIIILFTCNGDPDGVTVTDSAANVYRADGAPIANGTATTLLMMSSRLVNALPAASKITLTFGSTRTVGSFQAHVFTGLPSDAVDGIAVGTANAATAMTTGQLNTLKANDLVVSAFAMAGSSAVPTFTPGSGWTAAGSSRGLNGSARDLFVQWQVKGTAGAVTANATVNSAKNYAAIAVAFPAVFTGGGTGSGATGTYSTFSTLQANASIAVAGDVITLAADTTFTGHLELSGLRGTAAHPILITGPRSAVIDGTDRTGFGVRLSGCEYVTLTGFTVTRHQKGVVTDQANYCIIENLDVHHLDQEGIHLRNESCYNKVRGNVVHDTGLGTGDSPGYGEGLYCGQAVSNWTVSGRRIPDLMLGYPDHCDFNEFTGNDCYNVTAECMDIKEGTVGGVLANNTFNGSLTRGANSADSFIDAKGESWIISGNTGTDAMANGFEAHKVSSIDAKFLAAGGYTDPRGIHHPPVKSGDNNVFDGNTVHGVACTGFGFSMEGKVSGNVVYTNNVQDGCAEGLSNITTTVKP